METPLYHGTDSRILAMNSDERSAFKQDCLLAVDYLWPFFEPYFHGHCKVPLNKPGMEGCTTIESKMMELKTPLHFDQNQTVFYNLWDALNRIDAQKRGVDDYQYDDFYLTNMLDRAINYAERAFAFGEIGLNAYRLLVAALMIQFSDWNPDEKTAQAIARIKEFGEAASSPVILVFTNYIPENLRDEKGDELLDILLPSHKGCAGMSYRYLGELDVSSAVQLSLQEALQKQKEIEKSRLCY